VAVSFIGGGNRKTLRKPPTCDIVDTVKAVNINRITDGSE
jgi:hypothetical protein